MLYPYNFPWTGFICLLQHLNLWIVLSYVIYTPHRSTLPNVDLAMTLLKAHHQVYLAVVLST